jgi:hypothetical protein
VTEETTERTVDGSTSWWKLTMTRTPTCRRKLLLKIDFLGERGGEDSFSDWKIVATVVTNKKPNNKADQKGKEEEATAPPPTTARTRIRTNDEPVTIGVCDDRSRVNRRASCFTPPARSHRSYNYTTLLTTLSIHSFCRSRRHFSRSNGLSRWKKFLR